MIGVAVVAVGFAVGRVNPALGIFAACVLCLSLARTIDRINRSLAVGVRMPLWRRIWTFGLSVIVATFIISVSEIVFFFFHPMSGGPREISPIAASLGACLAVLTAIKMRRWLWPDRLRGSHSESPPGFHPPPEIWSVEAERAVERLIAESPRESEPWVRAEARRLAALPIGWDLWSYWFLRPKGEVVVVDVGRSAGHEESSTAWPKLLSALVRGSERYPELTSFLPSRAPGAEDCLCRGREPFNSGTVICLRCGGLGWLPLKSASQPPEL